MLSAIAAAISSDLSSSIVKPFSYIPQCASKNILLNCTLDSRAGAERLTEKVLPWLAELMSSPSPDGKRWLVDERTKNFQIWTHLLTGYFPPEYFFAARVDFFPLTSDSARIFAVSTLRARVGCFRKKGCLEGERRNCLFSSGVHRRSAKFLTFF